MFAWFLVIWIILNGRLTWEVFAIGVVLCVPLGLFCVFFLGYSLRRELRIIKHIPWCIHYIVVLLSEIVKANFAVMRLILSNRLEPEPVLFTFRTKIKSEAAKVLLANSITLTPGTITVKQTGDRFVVHALDREIAEGTENSVFTEMILAAENDTDADAADGKEARA